MADLVRFQNRQYSLDERRKRKYIKRVYAAPSRVFGVFYVIRNDIFMLVKFRMTSEKEKKMNTQETTKRNKKLKTMIQVAMLAALSAIIMRLEIPLPFAPPFYKLDFSEIPVLVGTFALGVIPGIAIEFLKIALDFLIDGSITGGIGELANFLIGCSFVVPAGIIYRMKKSRKQAAIGIVVGVLSMATIGGLMNAFILLPVYSKIMQIPIDALIEMGAKVNALVVDLRTFIFYCVIPFNLTKGMLTGVSVFLMYKKIRPIFKM